MSLFAYVHVHIWAWLYLWVFKNVFDNGWQPIKHCIVLFIRYALKHCRCCNVRSCSEYIKQMGENGSTEFDCLHSFCFFSSWFFLSGCTIVSMKNKWHMWTDPTAFCEWGWGWETAGTAGEEIREVDWLLLHTRVAFDWMSEEVSGLGHREVELLLWVFMCVVSLPDSRSNHHGKCFFCTFTHQAQRFVF